MLTGKQRDKSGAPLAGYDKGKTVAWIVTALLVVIGAFAGPNAGGGAADAGSPASVHQVQPAKPVEEPAATAPAEQAKKWTKVIALKGGNDKASETFDLTGAEARISYEFTGGGDFAVGAVYLEKEGVDIATDGGIPLLMLDKAETANTVLHKAAGRYYLDVKAAGFDGWTLTVEEKR